jgi:hypothetical protein
VWLLEGILCCKVFLQTVGCMKYPCKPNRGKLGSWPKENQKTNRIIRANIQNLKASTVPYAVWNGSCEIVSPYITAYMEGNYVNKDQTVDVICTRTAGQLNLQVPQASQLAHIRWQSSSQWVTPQASGDQENRNVSIWKHITQYAEQLL